MLSREEVEAMNRVQLMTTVCIDAHTYKEAATKLKEDINSMGSDLGR